MFEDFLIAHVVRSIQNNGKTIIEGSGNKME